MRPWTLIAALSAALCWSCGDESCHMGTHVGAYRGTLSGEVSLTVSRVDDTNLVDVRLAGAHDDLIATARLETA